MQLARQALALFLHGQGALLFEQVRPGALLLGDVVQQDQVAQQQVAALFQRGEIDGVLALRLAASQADFRRGRRTGLRRGIRRGAAGQHGGDGLAAQAGGRSGGRLGGRLGGRFGKDALGGRVQADDGVARVQHQHAVAHQHEHRPARQGQRVEHAQPKQGHGVGDGVEGGGGDAVIGLDPQLGAGAIPDQGGAHGYLPAQDQHHRPAVRRGAHEQPGQHRQVEQRQQQAGIGQQRECRAALRRKLAVEGKTAPHPMVGAVGQDEQAAHQQVGRQRQAQRARQQALQAGVRQHKPQPGNDQRAGEEILELAPEAFCGKTDGRPLERHPGGPQHPQRHQHGEDFGPGHAPVTPAETAQDGHQDGRAEDQPGLCAESIGPQHVCNPSKCLNGRDGQNYCTGR